ncbi:MAG: hypothetical protein JWQ30_2551 [Sediminibacterium sp.]|nr:hypothetical protein [Sediminibacterium sp.]
MDRGSLIFHCINISRKGEKGLVRNLSALLPKNNKNYVKAYVSMCLLWFNCPCYSSILEY